MRLLTCALAVLGGLALLATAIAFLALSLWEAWIEAALASTGTSHILKHHYTPTIERLYPELTHQDTDQPTM